MSRLIVKNLPNKTNADKLKEKFSEKGAVTDVQLKFTPDGRFRKFAFIGYKSENEAQEAIQYFNNTFFNAAKIRVELCADLGSVEKPKAWSKYAHDSSVNQKSKKGVSNEKKTEDEEKREKKKKEKSNNTAKHVDSELVEKIKQLKDEPTFQDFLEIHGSADKVLKLAESDSGVDESESGEDSEKESNGGEESKQQVKLANAPISDLEYLRLKTKGTKLDDEDINKLKTKVKTKKFESLFTIKVRNLPDKVKKKDIKSLFAPNIPASIRRVKLSGIAFIGFKTQKEVKQALVKNKTFIQGKQILISEYIDKNKEKAVPSRWVEQAESLKQEETIAESGRIFIRNLPYTVKEEEVEQLFSKFGDLTETIVPIDKFTRKVKGYGVVTFLMPEHAVAAYTALDGTVFQGRMLHLIPGKSKDSLEDEEEGEGGSYKKKKMKALKATAGSSHNWNTLFLGRDAVAETVAAKYQASKQDLLTGSEAAVRLALGETQIVAATRQFLENSGVSLDAFNQVCKKRSKTVILVKNLPASTTQDEIKEKFEQFGILGRVLLPPSGITALVEFEEPSEARAAFTKLSYSKFKNLPLYLEWAPDNTFVQSQSVKKGKTAENTEVREEEMEHADEGETKQDIQQDTSDEELEPEPDTTLFVKNLNFETDEEKLKQHFGGIGKLASVTVSRKKDPTQPGKMLSMGYGFVQFYKRSSLNDALIKLQGSSLDGHTLELKRSNRTHMTSVVDTRKKTNVAKQVGKKILVRNIPFQATQKEIIQLFKTFGELQFVRLPKKMVGTGPHRGFAFVEYCSKHDAKQAMKALCQSTHLYGRRLVLEWAEEDEEVEAIRKRTAKHFHQDTPKKSKKATADIEIENDSDEEAGM